MRNWLIAWMLCWAGLAWSFVCVPQPPTGLDEAEEAAREGYAGYQPTGDKGALERDALWWGAVRPVRREGRLTGYALRRADAAWRDAVYDSITPVALGGPRHGFIAGRGGCVRLLDTTGRPLVPEWLAQIQVESDVPGVSPDTVWLKLTAPTGPQRSAYTLVRFVRGRLEVRQASGLMVLREAGEPSRWRVVGRDGRDLYAQRFEGFEHLGCGSVRLRRDGQWLQLQQDGTLSERLRFPFSC